MKLNWEDDHSRLLIHVIVKKCKSAKAKKEIKKFEERLRFIEGLQIICDKSQYDDTMEFEKFYVVINKPYNIITLKEYKEIKAYIVKILGSIPSVFRRLNKLVYSSLHIEWLIIVEAVPYMIEMAKQKKDVFLSEKFVFMQIGTEIIFDVVCIFIIQMYS